MDYNSQKELLIIPEYGRNIQNMINYAKTIEDDEYRQVFVEKIVDLMNQMNPQNKNLNEYKDKLWKHVFRIAEYDLKVVPPNGKAPDASEGAMKPEQMEYPPNESTFRHYGHNVKQLIKKALEMEDLEKRQEFTNIIGSYMKMAYRTWNREHYVSDEIVKEDLLSMSNGVLTLSEGLVLDTVHNIPKNRKRNNYKNKGGDRRDSHRGRNHKKRRR